MADRLIYASIHPEQLLADRRVRNKGGYKLKLQLFGCHSRFGGSRRLVAMFERLSRIKRS